MNVMASQLTSLTIVYSTVYLGADQRIHQRSASLAFVQGIHRWPVNSPHKGPVMRKMFPFDDVIMYSIHSLSLCCTKMCSMLLTKKKNEKIISNLFSISRLYYWLCK